MQAIELQATIDENHQIHLQLPDDYPPQVAKVIVLLETISAPPLKKRHPKQAKACTCILFFFRKQLEIIIMQRFR